MRILFCSGEVYPFSKTGGLADVAYALPRALARLGHEVKVISPYYKGLKIDKSLLTLKGVGTVLMGTLKQEALFYETILDDISYIFVDNKQYFDRDSFYNELDDAERFLFFNYAILESLPVLDYFPNIIHVNDWQTSLVPYLLEQYRKDTRYQHIETLLSIHNLEKQGAFDINNEHFFNTKNFTYIHLNQINFLKCGIMRASRINTVSQSYRDEILTKFYGFTLDGPLKARQFDLTGIINGLDERLYDPTNSQNLPFTYSMETVSEGKKHNKAFVLKELNFKNESLPLLSFIGRFGRQKGLNILMDTLESYLKQEKFNLIVIGKGDSEYEVYFNELKERYPDHVYYHNGFDHVLSQKTYAASDIFLMPSLFEPCGLNQMIAMKYGAIPLVRSTGGLKDTVINILENPNDGTGYAFSNYDKNEFISVLNQALEDFNDKDIWHQMQTRAMSLQFSISDMAKSYAELYQEILEDHI